MMCQTVPKQYKVYQNNEKLTQVVVLTLGESSLGESSLEGLSLEESCHSEGH